MTIERKESKVKPVFKHDCKSCQFLATISVTGIDIPPKKNCTYDLYYCPSSRGFPTIVARYGDGGSEYISGTDFATVHPVIAFGLIAAKRLRKDLGIYRNLIGGT